jgi:hypothetical protein
MKKIILLLALCSFTATQASDKDAFLRKFERKMAAASSSFKFGKQVSAAVTVEVDANGKTRVVNMVSANEAEAERLKAEIEKMNFNDTTCAGTHAVMLSIIPAGK